MFLKPSDERTEVMAHLTTISHAIGGNRYKLKLSSIPWHIGKDMCGILKIK